MFIRKPESPSSIKALILSKGHEHSVFVTSVDARSSASSTRPGASKAGLDSLELKEWKVGSGRTASAERNDVKRERAWKGTRARAQGLELGNSA